MASSATVTGSRQRARPAALRQDGARAWWLSEMVHERLAFSLHELRGRGHAHEYRLRDLPGRVVLRHNRSDAWVLHEVVRDSFYSPPPEVEALLPTAPQVLDLGGNLGFF